GGFAHGVGVSVRSKLRGRQRMALASANVAKGCGAAAEKGRTYSRRSSVKHHGNAANHVRDVKCGRSVSSAVSISNQRVQRRVGRAGNGLTLSQRKVCAWCS